MQMDMEQSLFDDSRSTSNYNMMERELSLLYMSVRDIFSGVVPFFAANAAAAPAACPIAMQDAWTRSPEFARRSLETDLPATMILRLDLGISAPSGTVGTVPGFNGFGLTPVLVWRSTG